MPAKERTEAVRCQRTEPIGGRRRIASGLATTDKQAIARAFGMTTRPERGHDGTNGGFPHQSYKPSKQRPTSTESLTP